MDAQETKVWLVEFLNKQGDGVRLMRVFAPDRDSALSGAIDAMKNSTVAVSHITAEPLGTAWEMGLEHAISRTGAENEHPT